HVSNSSLYLGLENGMLLQLEWNQEFESFSVSTDTSPFISLMPVISLDNETKSFITRARRFWYMRESSGRRAMVFLPDGTIGPGAARCERSWQVVNNSLFILGQDTVTAELSFGDEKFSGHWLSHEKSAVSLEPYSKIRSYSIYGLQRTCTNLVQHFFDTQVPSFRQTRFNQRGYWKHGFLPCRTALKGTFLIICVRHPLHWLSACYAYFRAQHGSDGTICQLFDPKWTFCEFLQNKHYMWPTPMDRWNCMYQHWLSRSEELGVDAVLVKAESLQSPHLQAQTFQSLVNAFDPFINVNIEDGIESNRLTNICSVSPRAMDHSSYWEERYLKQYTDEMLNIAISSLDITLAERLGYMLVRAKIRKKPIEVSNQVGEP
ncbi:MAG: hypothetical protein OJI67_19720, partial [Prosthecobacter sp.]|nr:hypothetical protein [Prosthecobacter sp.]